jgi:hypothetical protein
VVRSRSERYVDPGPLTGIPDVRDLRPKWHDRAACAGEKDEKLFFFEAPLYKQPKMLSSPSLLLPLLICSTCPVRRECLTAALTPPVFFHDEDDHDPAMPRTMGVWGGSFEADRNAVRGLPTVEAKIEALEATFPERLAVRIEAWRAALAERRAKHQPVTKRDKRIEAMLGTARGRAACANMGGCKRS